MIIRPDKLQSAISPTVPCYWLTGDEPVLIEDSERQLIDSLKQHGFSELETYHAMDAFDWGRFFTELKTQSLFHDKTLVKLKLWNTQLPERARQLLTNFTTNPPSNKRLIIISERLTAKQRQQTWFKTLSQQSVIVTIWPLSAGQHYHWLSKMLKQAGYQLNTQALRWLNDHTEGNLLSAKQLIEQLKLLYPPGPISDTVLQDLLASDTRFELFSINEAALKGDTGQAMKILAALKAHGYEPPLVLWTLATEIRRLYSMATDCYQSGQTVQQVLDHYKIWKPRQGPVKAALQRLQLNDYPKLLMLAGDIDLMIKGQKPGPVWQHITQLICKLTGARS